MRVVIGQISVQLYFLELTRYSTMMHVYTTHYFVQIYLPGTRTYEIHKAGRTDITRPMLQMRTLSFEKTYVQQQSYWVASLFPQAQPLLFLVTHTQ